MKCKEFEDLIPKFIEKKLDFVTTKLFLEHMQSCIQCKEELNIQFLVNEGLVRLEEGEAFDLQKEMRDMVGSARKKVRTHERFLRQGRWIELLVMLTAIAALAWILIR